MRYLLLIMSAVALHASFAPAAVDARPATGPATRPVDRTDALNRLRNEINAAYGYRDCAPRINLGPCGRFAKAFREQWNARFKDPINIVFVMAVDRDECFHVLVRLPDGNYFDGGNGVVTDRALLAEYTGGRLEEMTRFDPALLDKRSYGLNRTYPVCPNYSDELTARLIETHLSLLPRDTDRP
jgi:hypothetical protein